jgi:hypothetical protein
MDTAKYKMQKEGYQTQRKYGNKQEAGGNFLARNVDR